MNQYLNRNHMAIVILFSIITLCQPVQGQGTKEDYERSRQWRDRVSDKVFRDRIRPNWTGGDSALWYRLQVAPDQHRFISVNTASGVRAELFDHERLAALLSDAWHIKVDPQRIPIQITRYDPSKLEFHFSSDLGSWKCRLEDYELEKLLPGSNASKTAQTLQVLERSTDEGPEIEVTFHNDRAVTLQLHWIDRSGARQRYATIQPGQQHRQHTFVGHVWLLTDEEQRPIAAYRADANTPDVIVDESATAPRERPTKDKQDRSTSPDGKWKAEIRDHNLFLVAIDGSQTVALTSDGTSKAALTERIYWSPDSNRLLAIERTAGDEREIYLIESSPDDQLQPELHTFRYAKPGDRMPLDRPRLFDIPQAREISIDQSLFANPWRISDISWRPTSKHFTFLYNQRGHQVLRSILVDANTGESAALIDETSDTFIDYAYKSYHHFAPTDHSIIWMSERDGWNHLYRFDAETGQLKNQITKGNWVIRSVERIDDDQQRIWFSASGVYPEQDPYYLHFGYVNFDGSQLTWLTRGNGTHEIEYSPSERWVVDRYSRVDLPAVTELRDAITGDLVCTLEQADGRRLVESGWQPPIRFHTPGRDGETEIFGVIYFPSTVDRWESVPVIEKIYAGPQGSFVPKSFSAFRREQELAELGFIVVQIDGMGTSNRSKAFHDVCCKNLGDAGFPDRILWLRAAAERFPKIDLSRVGIYGGSAGGQNALRGLLMHPDVYKVGVADCGCHDNRMDKIWWNELWMGWPIGPHYAEQSNVTQAHRLQGKLLLTVGELDRNVDPASTMQVVDALIKADKDFDMLVVPGSGHGVGESPYADRRRKDFFMRHLWNQEPRQE